MQSSIDQYVIEAVKKKRIEEGYVQEDLSIALGLSTNFVGQIENPKRRAKYNLQHLNKLAVFLKCSPRDFLPQEPLGEAEPDKR